MKTKSSVLHRKQEAFLEYKKGMPVAAIAKNMNLSERMIYRYIDEYELVQLRKWQDNVDEALRITPLDAPVSQLLKVLKERA